METTGKGNHVSNGRGVMCHMGGNSKSEVRNALVHWNERVYSRTGGKPGSEEGRQPPSRKIYDFTDTVHGIHRGRGPRTSTTSPFDGETPSPRPRGHIPPGVFLLWPCSLNPTGRWGHGTPRKQQQQPRWRCPWLPCHPSRPGSFH